MGPTLYYCCRRSAQLCGEGSLERLAGEERGEKEAEEEQGAGESSLWRKSDQQPARGDCGPLCLGQQGQWEDLQAALGQHVASSVQGDQVSASVSPAGGGPAQCLPGKYSPEIWRNPVKLKFSNPGKILILPRS